jgi:murein DD-endopeptidase MepM/ murein hydrolase activator NlpD
MIPSPLRSASGVLAALAVLVSVAFAAGAALTGNPSLKTAVAAKPGLTILWPTPNPAFMQGGDLASWAQDTGTGDPHSGLFGCVRDDGHKFHEGIDIKCIQRDKNGDPSDPVSAAMDGQVMYINAVAGNGDYGRYIVLEHPHADVPVYTLYAHLSAIAPGLKAGQTVTAGQTIATLGHSGTEDIPLARAHLHFEIGLRLSDDFQYFYDAEKLPGKNAHGNYNGINLLGSDPQAFFEQVRTGKFKGFADLIRDIPTAFTLRVTTTRIPDFALRYPALLTKPVTLAGVAGWDIAFTWYGMPKQLTPLPAGTPGLGAPGAVALVSYDRAQFTGCTCRDTLIFGAAKNVIPTLGKYLDDNIKMLFHFK